MITILRQKISDAEQAGVREVPLSNLRSLIDQIEQGISGDAASQHESEEKKKREVEVRDLKPKTDPKGGTKEAKKDGERGAGRSGEADFMKGLK